MGPTENVLEDLYAARASLKSQPFGYSDWTQCACGHIYMAANDGVKADDNLDVVLPVDGGALTPVQHRYVAALRAIVEASGLRPRRGMGGHPHFALAKAVSDATGDIAEDEALDPLQVAQQLVERTIKHVEAQQREAMLDVAAQAAEFCVEEREVVPV